MKEKKHFLILRFSSLGDVTLQNYFLKKLQDHYGVDAKISFLTFSKFKDTIRTDILDQIDVHYVIKRKGFVGAKEIFAKVDEINKGLKVDLIVDLHGTLRSFFVKLVNPSISQVTLNKRKLERLLLVKTKFNLYKFFEKKARTQVERNISDFSSIFQWDKSVPILPSLNGKREDKIIIMPSAAHPSKRWPLDYFHKLIEKVLNEDKLSKYKVIVLGGKDDDFCFSLNSFSEKFPKRFFYLQGKLSLKDSIKEIKTSSLLVGNDTGLCHVAESYGVPVIMMMGPTSEFFGFSPIKKESVLMTHDVWCRPCHHTGAKKCFREELYCLTGIKPERVFLELSSLLLKGSSC